VKFVFIEAKRNSFDICVMCRVLEVTKPGFCA
jgi:hypothetical protein